MIVSINQKQYLLSANLSGYGKYMEYGNLFGCYTIAYNPRACNVSPPPRAEQWSTHLIRSNQLRARIDIRN